MLKQKCVYSPISAKSDGLRILATRGRGRGLPSNLYDAWMPNLGPSEWLLLRFRTSDMTWAEFSRHYRRELLEGGSADTANRLIKNHGQKFTLRLLQELGRRGPVTIMCHCSETEPHCHRRVLLALLRRKI